MNYLSYGGELNVPGAAGNRGHFLAGGNFMGGAGSAINPEAFRKDARQQKIYNKGINTDNPNEKKIFLDKAGPQLPLAYNPFSGTVPMGNAGFFAGPQGAALNSPMSNFNSFLDQLTNETIDRSVVPVQGMFPRPVR